MTSKANQPTDPGSKPTCRQCQGTRFTFTEIYGPQERATEIEQLVDQLKQQASARREECEKWFQQQKRSLEQIRSDKLNELNENVEDSAFLLLSDDPAVQAKVESIQQEYEKAKANLHAQKQVLEQRVCNEQATAMVGRVGPENILRAVFCASCGEIQSVVGCAEQSTGAGQVEARLEKLESAILAMHQDLVQCLKTLTSKFTVAAKPRA